MIPLRLLRDLTLQTPTTTTDAYGATVPDGWAETTIQGRIDQTDRAHINNQARDGSDTGWRLVTNSAAITDQCRVVADGLTFEVVARPWPVYAGLGIHHHEAALRLVEG
jgi:hypothetical protein